MKLCSYLNFTNIKPSYCCQLFESLKFRAFVTSLWKPAPTKRSHTRWRDTDRQDLLVRPWLTDNWLGIAAANKKSRNDQKWRKKIFFLFCYKNERKKKLKIWVPIIVGPTNCWIEEAIKKIKSFNGKMSFYNSNSNDSTLKKPNVVVPSIRLLSFNLGSVEA